MSIIDQQLETEERDLKNALQQSKKNPILITQNGQITSTELSLRKKLIAALKEVKKLQDIIDTHQIDAEAEAEDPITYYVRTMAGDFAEALVQAIMFKTGAYDLEFEDTEEEILEFVVEQSIEEQYDCIPTALDADSEMDAQYIEGWNDCRSAIIQLLEEENE